MGSVLGIVVVFCAVLGGFALESGRMTPLAQPAEIVIICGAAAGTLLVANPARVLKATLRQMAGVFRGTPFTAEFYFSSLLMLYGVFGYARRYGAARLEEQVDDPANSALFVRYWDAFRDPSALDYLCETLRLTSLASIPARELEALLEQEMEARNHVLRLPGETLLRLADSLPGLGILAAVLGVVITMQSLTRSPAHIGQEVGSALVGTFLGIFLSYGFVAPFGERLTKTAAAESQYYGFLRNALNAFARGMPPSVAVEFARRSIPPSVRPGSAAVEAGCRRPAAGAGKVSTIV